MAIRKIYIGSFGPFEYDDTLPANDPDGDFPGEDHKSILTDGQMRVEQVPVEDEEVLRLVDLAFRVLPPVSVVNVNNPTELNTLAGDLGALVLAYEIIGATGQNEYTLYAYDASGPAVNVPYVMDADGAGDERWIAIGGKYAAQVLRLNVLTATKLIANNANKELVSTNLSAWVDGTALQITITDDGDGTITISIPAPFRVPATGANYIQFAANGLVSLSGTARVTRHLRVGAASWSHGASAPTEGHDGPFVYLAFDNVVDDEIHYTVIVPYRWDISVDVEFVADWYYVGGQDNGTVCWALEYKAVKAGEVVTGAGVTIIETTAGNHLTGQMVRTTFTTKILLGNLEAGDTLGFKLYRDVSGDTLATNARLLNTHFHFTQNKLGKAT